jgi:hypothetical protein
MDQPEQRRTIQALMEIRKHARAHPPNKAGERMDTVRRLVEEFDAEGKRSTRRRRKGGRDREERGGFDREG